MEAIGGLPFAPKKRYYTLRSPFTTSNERTYIPTNGENALRAVITPEEALACLRKLGELEVKPCRTKKWQQLSQHYEELFSSPNLDEHLRLFKEVSLKKQAGREKGLRISETDEQYRRKIERLLSEEFAVVLQESPSASKERLYSALKS